MNFYHTIFASNTLGYVILGLAVIILTLVLTALFRCVYYTGKTCQLCCRCCCCCCCQLQDYKRPVVPGGENDIEQFERAASN